MKIDEVRSLATEALKEELEGYYRELFNLRFQKVTQQLSNTSTIGKTRTIVARIQTVLRERELAEEAAN